MTIPQTSINIQLAADTLLAMVRKQLRPSIECFPGTHLIESQAVWVDHIELATSDGFQSQPGVANAAGFIRRGEPDSTTIAHVQFPMGTMNFDELAVRPVEVVVPALFHLRPFDEMAWGTPTLHPASNLVHLVFTLSGGMNRLQQPWQPVMQAAPKSVDWLEFLNIAPLTFRLAFGGVFVSQVPFDIPIGPDPVFELLGGGDPRFLNAGISIDVPDASDAHATRVGFRWEVGQSSGMANLGALQDTYWAWNYFHNSGVLGQVGQSEGEWSVLVPTALLEHWWETTVAAQLAEYLTKPDPKIEILSWPSADWFGKWGIPSMFTSFDIDVLTPFPCVLNDIGVTVTLLAQFALESGKISGLVTIARSIWDGDVAWCSVNLGNIAPVGLSEAVKAIVTTVVAGVVAANYDPALEDYLDLSAFPGDCQWVTQGEEFKCLRAVPIPALPGAHLIPTMLVANTDGLVLAGGAVVYEPLSSWWVPDSGLMWTEPGLCDKWSPYASAKVVTVTGPAHVCSAEILGDSFDQFAPFLSIKGGVVQVGPIHEEDVKPEYVDSQYSCRVVVVASDGRAEFNLGLLPPAPKQPDLTDAEEAAQKALKKIKCNSWAEWWGGRALKPLWWTDPGPIAELLEYVWQIKVASAAAGSQVDLTAQGPVASLFPGEEGNTSLEVVVPGQTSVMATLTGLTGRLDIDRPLAVVSLEQALLKTTGKVPLGAPCFAACVADQGKVAWCATPAGLVAIDLGDPARPFVLRQLRLPGLKGVAVGPRGNLIAWGETGLWFFGPHAAAQQLVEDAVTDVAVTGTAMHALCANQVLTLLEDGSIAHRLAIDGWTRLASSGGVLMLGGPLGVAVQGGNRGRLTMLPVGDGRSCLRLTNLGRRQILAEHSDGSATVLRTRGHRVTVSATVVRSESIPPVAFGSSLAVARGDHEVAVRVLSARRVATVEEIEAAFVSI